MPQFYSNIDMSGCKINALGDPATGTDGANKQYVDAQITAAGTTGQRLGVSTRTTPLTIAANSAITGLSITLTGTGHYVDVQLFLPAVYHATAATFINVAILVNGTAEQLAQTVSYVNTGGPFIHLTYERLLTNAVSYTFTGFLASGAGNVTVNAGATFPMEMKVTQR